MIDTALLELAREQSNAVSTTSVVATLAEARIEQDAVAGFAQYLIAAFVGRGMGPADSIAAAFASGLELGVRAARLEQLPEQ